MVVIVDIDVESRVVHLAVRPWRAFIPLVLLCTALSCGIGIGVAVATKDGLLVVVVGIYTNDFANILCFSGGRATQVCSSGTFPPKQCLWCRTGASRKLFRMRVVPCPRMLAQRDFPSFQPICQPTGSYPTSRRGFCSHCSCSLSSPWLF